MKKNYLFWGIVLLVIAVFLILVGFLARFMFHNVLDGSFSLYERYKKMMRICFPIGGLTLVISIVFFVLNRNR